MRHRLAYRVHVLWAATLRFPMDRAEGRVRILSVLRTLTGWNTEKQISQALKWRARDELQRMVKDGLLVREIKRQFGRGVAHYLLPEELAHYR